MTEYRPKELAREAEQLLENGVLNKAIEDIRAEAVDTLVKADAGDPIAVLKAQARYEACEEITLQLNRYILAVS